MRRGIWHCSYVTRFSVGHIATFWSAAHESRSGLWVWGVTETGCRYQCFCSRDQSHLRSRLCLFCRSLIIRGMCCCVSLPSSFNVRLRRSWSEEAQTFVWQILTLLPINPRFALSVNIITWGMEQKPLDTIIFRIMILPSAFVVVSSLKGSFVCCVFAVDLSEHSDRLSVWTHTPPQAFFCLFYLR